jgi:hypothetical protein
MPKLSVHLLLYLPVLNEGKLKVTVTWAWTHCKAFINLLLFWCGFYPLLWHALFVCHYVTYYYLLQRCQYQTATISKQIKVWSGLNKSASKPNLYRAHYQVVSQRDIWCVTNFLPLLLSEHHLIVPLYHTKQTASFQVQKHKYMDIYFDLVGKTLHKGCTNLLPL